MIQTQSKTLTLEDFLKLPETEPASEYIDSTIIQKLMPQGQHSIIQCELAAALNAILKPKKIARAFTELRCTFGGQSTVPDVSVFLWNRIPRMDDGKIANTFLIAPDWTIEILSPLQSQIKVTKKILHYLKHNTQMGWLIAPDDNSVIVYQPLQQIEIFDEPEAMLPVPSFAGEFQITVTDLFAWLFE